MLQYNKLYQSLKKVTAEWHAGHVEWGYSWVYLKFYEDGIFISTMVDGDDPNQIDNWFNQDAEHITKGTFKIIQAPKILLQYPNNVEIVGGLVKDDKLLIEGKNSWELFSPLY